MSTYNPTNSATSVTRNYTFGYANMPAPSPVPPTPLIKLHIDQETFFTPNIKKEDREINEVWKKGLNKQHADLNHKTDLLAEQC